MKGFVSPMFLVLSYVHASPEPYRCPGMQMSECGQGCGLCCCPNRENQCHNSCEPRSQLESRIQGPHNRDFLALKYLYVLLIQSKTEGNELKECGLCHDLNQWSENQMQEVFQCTELKRKRRKSWRYKLRDLEVRSWRCNMQATGICANEQLWLQLLVSPEI